MTRDEGVHLPVCKRLPSQESLLKYDADAVAMGPRTNCRRHYGRERVASFVNGPATDGVFAKNVCKTWNPFGICD